MGARKRANVGIRPYKGDGDSATGQTHRPLLIPPRRGRRPRRPAPTARPASAERERKGIRALPGPKVSPRGTRLMRTATRNGQPSPAGGRRYALCADRPAVAFFSFGPSTAQPLAALPLTDAAYPLRVRPVCLRPKCRRFCDGWPTTRACGRSLFGKTEWGPRASPAKRVAWGKAEQTERADFVTPLMGGGLPGHQHGPCPRSIGRTPPFSPGGVVLR